MAKRPRRNENQNEVVEEDRDQKYRKNVTAKNESQREYIKAIHENNLVFGVGPAGTGKTYLAVSVACEYLTSGKVDRILLTRPAVEADEKLGYLPGTLEEKMAPYLRPLYDCLLDRLGVKRLREYQSASRIEIAPLAYMRGRTLNNSIIIGDEFQNCTSGQIKMFLTRFGFNSKMIVTGDPDQSDIDYGDSGLAETAHRVEPLDGVGVVRFSRRDVVRHPLVGEILDVL